MPTYRPGHGLQKAVSEQEATDVRMSRTSATRVTAAALGLALALTACGGDDAGADKGSASAAAQELSGTISGDGSSTVFPIMEGIVEDFGQKHPKLKLQVGESGTGGGFEKFCNGETDFSNASRPIKDEEKAACAKKGVEFEEFKIASDGLSVMTNPDNKIDCLSIDELKTTFVAGSTVKKFSDIKPDLPGESIKIFMPGADSGTYDFFLEEVLGKESKFRTDDVTASEDDNQLVQGIAGSKGGFGFFGYAYYAQNKDKLSIVKVKGDGECVEPSADTVRDGSYPLSRPLFVYVKKDALARPEVTELIRYIASEEGLGIIEEVGYVTLEDADYAAISSKLGS
jgi:phosphate transport system substrate-binding protein